jgi:hypothetical protein
MLDDVMGFGEGLKKFGGQLACHGVGLGCITAWMDQGLPVSVGVRPVAS